MQGCWLGDNAGFMAGWHGTYKAKSIQPTLKTTTPDQVALGLRMLL